MCTVCRDAWLGGASAGSVADLLFDYPLLRLVLYILSGCPARFIRSFFPAPSRRRPFALFDFGFGGVDYICTSCNPFEPGKERPTSWVLIFFFCGACLECYFQGRSPSKSTFHRSVISDVSPLVRFSLICAATQSLMLLSTGERLRMARDALAERLKVLVAKSALSQLGE